MTGSPRGRAGEPRHVRSWAFSSIRREGGPGLLVVSVGPHSPLLPTIRGARIDVAVEPTPRGRRHALRIVAVGTVAGKADASTLEAIAIVVSRRWRAAGHRCSSRGRKRQKGQHCIAHHQSPVETKPSSRQDRNTIKTGSFLLVRLCRLTRRSRLSMFRYQLRRYYIFVIGLKNSGLEISPE